KVGVPASQVDELLAEDQKRRQFQHQLDDLRSRRARESRELGKASPEEREKKRDEMRALGDQISAGEHELTEIEKRCEELMLELPNMPRPYVPVGAGEAENKIVRTEGEQRAFSFKPVPHWELGEELGM